EATARVPSEFGSAVEVRGRGSDVAEDANFTGDLDGLGDSSDELSGDLVAVRTAVVVVEVLTAEVDRHAFSDGGADGAADAEVGVEAGATDCFTRQSNLEHVEGGFSGQQAMPSSVGTNVLGSERAANLEGVEGSSDT